MLVLIDTNELLRMAALLGRSPLFAAWRDQRFDLVVTEALLSEFQRVSAKPRVRRFLRVMNSRQFVEILRERAVFVEPAFGDILPHCRDVKDEIIVAAAIAARVDFVVTNDGDLLDPPFVAQLFDEYGILVMQPGNFSARFSR